MEKVTLTRVGEPFNAIALAASAAGESM